MSIDYSFKEKFEILNDCLTIIPIYAEKELPQISKKIKLSEQQIKALKDIKLNLNSIESFFTNISQHPYLFLIIKKPIKSKVDCYKIGKLIFQLTSKFSYKNIQLLGTHIFSKTREIEFLREIIFVLESLSYQFLKYKTEKNKISIYSGRFNIITSFPKELENKILIDKYIQTGISTVRNLCSEPSNVLFPRKFVEFIEGLEEIGIKVEILNEDDMKKLGMNALLCVGKGSTKSSYLAIMKWEGGRKSDKPIAFVGKGVCFDTGGISIKPSRNMDEMKSDMAGAAIVTGAMQSIALQNLKKNIIGVVGLVENMPDGNSIKPGDIIKSMSGKTIEILNTDAEGRLVLADALFYVNKYFKPKAIIDLATLTGAIIVALGNERAGLFSNNDKLASQMFISANRTKELVWRLPLGDHYSSKLKSKIADLQNIGTSAGSSIQAACFLENFVGSTPWVHLDIAGVMEMKSISNGWGVKLLDDIAKTIKL